jgi:hypothetical protein
MQEVYERVRNGADPDRVYNAWGFLKLDRVRRDRSRMTREHQPIQGDDDFHDDGVGSLERIHLARQDNGKQSLVGSQESAGRPSGGRAPTSRLSRVSCPKAVTGRATGNEVRRASI